MSDTIEDKEEKKKEVAHMKYGILDFQCLFEKEVCCIPLTVMCSTHRTDKAY